MENTPMSPVSVVVFSIDENAFGRAGGTPISSSIRIDTPLRDNERSGSFSARERIEDPLSWLADRFAGCTAAMIHHPRQIIGSLKIIGLMVVGEKVTIDRYKFDPIEYNRWQQLRLQLKLNLH
jgi:hypothetical protein